MKWQLIQAYKQAPWRVQLLWASRAAVFLLFVFIFAGLYLGINEQITTTGLDIQRLDTEKEDLQRNISSEMSKFASLTSNKEMKQRVDEQKYSFPEEEDVLYIYIPGYIAPQTANLAPLPILNISNLNPIKPGYQTSLWDVIVEFTSQIIKNQDNGGNNQ